MSTKKMNKNKSRVHTYEEQKLMLGKIQFSVVYARIAIY